MSLLSNSRSVWDSLVLTNVAPAYFITASTSTHKGWMTLAGGYSSRLQALTIWQMTLFILLDFIPFLFSSSRDIKIPLCFRNTHTRGKDQMRLLLTGKDHNLQNSISQKPFNDRHPHKVRRGRSGGLKSNPSAGLQWTEDASDTLWKWIMKNADSSLLDVPFWHIVKEWLQYKSAEV